MKAAEARLLQLDFLHRTRTVRMLGDRFLIVLLWPGAKGSRPTHLPGLKAFCLGVLFSVWAKVRRARHPPTLWTIHFSWNGLIFVVQTSGYHQNDRNFEPDPFLRSRRSEMNQKWHKTTFFNKKSIFVEVGPCQNTFNLSQARPWAGPKANVVLF